MRIAITTPHGHIGSKVVDRLLDTGEHELVLLAHHADKVKDAQKRGATVMEGDLTDVEFVKKATENIDALFWVNPPNQATDDFIGYYKSLAENAAEAIKANNIPRTVLISSIGAHLGKGVGVINAFHDVETILRDATQNLVILRPTYFMENIAGSSQMIATQHAIMLPVSGKAHIPMIATKDIADEVVKRLTEPFTGQEVKPLLGPKDYQFDEVANIIGKQLNEDVKFQQVTPEQAVQAMTGQGVSEHVAKLYVEMHDAIDKGRLESEQGRNDLTTTPTTFEEFAGSVIAPTVKSMESKS